MIDKILQDIGIDIIARHTCGNNHFQQDLTQELYLYVLEMPRDKVIYLYENDQLRKYLYKASWIMYNGENGSFYKKYREIREIELEELPEDNQYDIIKEIINEADLLEMERLWLYVFLELDGNYTWIESRTGISRGCATKRIKEIIEKCKGSI